MDIWGIVTPLVLFAIGVQLLRKIVFRVRGKRLLAAESSKEA